MVLGYGGPLVRQDFDLPLARIDHRLNGKGHAFFQNDPGAWPAVVEHLGVVMKHLRNTMAAKFSDHAEMVVFRVALNGVANITQPGPRANLFNSFVHTFLCDFA